MTAVNAPAILRDLNEQWRAAAAESAGGVLRACSMTLIAVAGFEDAAASRVLEAVVQQYPNRTVLVRLRKEGGISARAAIVCWMPHGSRRHVCSEQIEIASTVADFGEVLPSLRGLVAPDLPVYLWTPDAALASSDWLRPAAGMAGKILTDSTPLPQRHAAAALRRLRRPGRLADLAWTRITRWRERIAQDAEPQDLRGDAEISYAGEGVPMPALYLAAWLEMHGIQPVSLRCEDPAAPGAGMGRIRQVRIGGLTVHRTAPSVVVTRRRGVCWTSVFPRLDDAALLGEELGIPGADPAFETALEKLLERMP